MSLAILDKTEISVGPFDCDMHKQIVHVIKYLMHRYTSVHRDFFAVRKVVKSHCVNLQNALWHI